MPEIGVAGCLQYSLFGVTDDGMGNLTGLVEDSLAEVGAIRAYDKAMAQYQAIPFVPDVKADLGRYVVEKAMDGIFYYLAREEAAIRRDPLKRSSKILEKVFGAAKD